jgi:hypothetical protein
MENVDKAGKETIRSFPLGFHARELWKLHLKHGNFQEILEIFISKFWKVGKVGAYFNSTTTS